MKTTRKYEKEIERVENINELVWIATDFKQDMTIKPDDLLHLCRKAEEKREAFLKEGQRYSIARKPAWR